MSLHILRPGLLTTVQDLGRVGFQQDGIIVSGAMDAQALRVANLLVGNEETAAGLEITLAGPVIRFDTDHLLALTGAPLAATLNGRLLGLNRAVWVAAGTELACGPVRAGCRAYLAVAGGVAVRQVLGSRSTYLRAGFGGLAGRALRAGDVLPVGEPSALGARIREVVGAAASSAAAAATATTIGAAAFAAARFTPGPALCPVPAAQPLLRAVRGPEYGQFSAASQQAFWREPFAITPEADRMGYRLHGPPLRRPTPTELLSGAVTFGTVQVPAGGQPIVLLADHQTTGGYPRLAQVISADFSGLAQARPGQQLRFREVTLEEAQTLYLAQEQRLRALRQALASRAWRF